MRKQLTDWQVLDMVLRTWVDADGGDARRTAVFLWAALAVVVATLLGTFAWEWYGPKQDCNDGTGAQPRIECTQGGEGKAGREGQKVRHGGQSAGTARGRA